MREVCRNNPTERAPIEPDFAFDLQLIQHKEED